MIITFPLVDARLVCRCCASVYAIFENLYFTRYSETTRFGVVKSLTRLSFIANCPQCASERILKIR